MIHFCLLLSILNRFSILNVFFNTLANFCSHLPSGTSSKDLATYQAHFQLFSPRLAHRGVMISKKSMALTLSDQVIRSHQNRSIRQAKWRFEVDLEKDSGCSVTLDFEDTGASINLTSIRVIVWHSSTQIDHYSKFAEAWRAWKERNVWWYRTRNSRTNMIEWSRWELRIAT